MHIQRRIIPVRGVLVSTAAVAFYTVMISGVFVNSLLGSESLLADVALLVVGLAPLALLFRRRVPAALLLLVGPFIALLALYSVSTAGNPEFNAAKHTVSLVLAITVFSFAFQYAAQIVTHKLYLPVCALAVATASLIVLDGQFAARNASNGLLAYSLILFAIGSAVRGARRVLLAAYLVICIVSIFISHRALSVLAGGLTLYTAFQMFGIGRRAAYRAVIVACGVLVPLTVLTMTDRGPISLTTIDDIFIEWSGRRATSGRDLIWSQILELTELRPLMGWGAGVVFSDFYDTRLSAHSMYMQIALQTGYTGLVLFCGGLLAMAMFISSNARGAWSVRHTVASSTLIFVIVHSATETFLLQNLLNIGVLAWLALGLSFGMLRDHAQFGHSTAPVQPKTGPVARRQFRGLSVGANHRTLR